MKIWFWTSLFSVLVSNQALGAACCGGGSSGASLIIGDYQSQFSLTSSYSQVIGEQSGSNDVIFWRDGRRQRTLTYKLSASTIIYERLQAGLSFEYLQKKYDFYQGARESSRSLGDSNLFISYEILEESFYRSKQPRVFLSLTHTFPTGTGLEEARSRALSDVNGLGRHQSMLGVHLYKRWPGLLWQGKVDFYRRFARTFDHDVSVGSSYGASMQIGVTRIPPKSAWSYGVSISAHVNEGKVISNPEQFTQHTPQERYFELAPTVSYSFLDNWSLDATYIDQTIIGPVKNTTLSRTFALTLNKFILL